MENIVEIHTSMYCDLCDKQGFFCPEYNEGDNVYCPICGGLDSDYTLNLFDEVNLEKYGYDYDDKPHNITGNKEIERIVGHYEYEYCIDCKILYHRGSRHYSESHRTVYNGQLVGKWEYQGEIYIGMPRFDDEIEYFKTIKDIKILELVEPNVEAGIMKCNLKNKRW